MRQKRGEAVVAAPKPPPSRSRRPERRRKAGRPRRRRRRSAAGRPKQPPEDALALLNALEAKETLTKDDVRAPRCATSDDERACQLLDDACNDDQVALEACSTTLTLASEKGGAFASAERTNERAQQLRRQARAGLDVEEGLTALSDLIASRALEDAAVAAACGAAGAVLQTKGTPTALLVWRAAARSYPSHRAALLEDWLDIARTRRRSG